jgi:hypothetical protein
MIKKTKLAIISLCITSVILFVIILLSGQNFMGGGPQASPKGRPQASPQGGSGSGTVNSGTAGELGWYESTGTEISGTSTTYIASLISNGLTGTIATGTAGQLAYYPAEGQAVYGTSSIFMTPTGYFGVGTTTPAYKLDVYGNARVDGSLTLSPLATPAGTFLAVNTVGQVIATSSPSGSGSGTVETGTAGQLGYYAVNGTTINGTSSIFVTPVGRVGINYATPDALLHVRGTGGIIKAETTAETISSVLSVNDAGGGDGRVFDVQCRRYGGQCVRIEYPQGHSATGFQISGGTGDAIEIAKSSGFSNNFLIAKIGSWNSINLASSTSYIMGNVGIGTNTPSQALSVQGSVLADSYLEYSPLFVGDSLSKIINIKEKTGSKDGDWAEVDHDTLPEGVRHESTYVVRTEDGTKMVEKEVDGEIKLTEEKKYKEDTKTFVGRNLGNLVQLIQKGVKELYEISVALTGRIEVLEADNSLLKTELCKKDNTYAFCN